MQIIKRNHNRLQRMLIGFLIVLILLINSSTATFAGGDSPNNRIPSHPQLGIADINTGTEAGHLRDTGRYDEWFEANYDQANNLGVQWNRWAVEWSRVEPAVAGLPTVPLRIHISDAHP